MTDLLADVRSQACGYLRAGKVTVLVATGRGGGDRPMAVRAHVQGQSSRYLVRRNYDGRWLCSCEAEADGCAHIASVRLVTGHDGPARKSGESR